MKLALIGRSMISPFGLAIRPRMPASWRICLNDPRAPELAIMKMGLRWSRLSSIASADLVGGRVPLVGDRLVALLLGDQAHVVLVLDLGDLGLVAAPRISSLFGRDDDVVLGDRDAGLGRVLEPEVLERVEHQRDRRRAVGLHQLVDELRQSRASCASTG